MGAYRVCPVRPHRHVAVLTPTAGPLPRVFANARPFGSVESLDASPPGWRATQGVIMAGSGADPRRGCLGWFVGCLVVPVCVVLALVLVASLRSGIREGHIVFHPEVRGERQWEVEGLSGEVIGGWWTGGSVVYGTEHGVTAVGDGEELWRLEPSETVCGMGAETRGGVGLVLLEGDIEEPEGPGGEEGGQSCDTVLLVDVDSGEEVWRSGPLADGDHGESELLFSYGSDAARAGGQVLVRVGGELVGLDADSGEELWRRGALGSGGAACPVADLLVRGSSEVVVVGDCGIDGTVTVHVVAPATGEDVSAFEFARGRSGPRTESVGRSFLIAADPIHVRVDLGHRGGAGSEGYDPDADAGREGAPVLAFDDDGRLRNELDVRGLFSVDGGERPYVVEGGRIYTSTDNPSCSNEVHAHDLGSGELVWETAVGDPGVSVIDVREGRLLLMLDGDGSFGECFMFGPAWEWQLYSLEAATGEGGPLSRPLGLRQPRASDLWWTAGGMVQVDRDVTDGPHTVLSYR